MQNTQMLLNEDLKFLSACCQIDPSEDVSTYIHAFLNAEDRNHDNLISLANQHGILPLVYLALQDAAIENLDLLSRFKQAYLFILGRNMLMNAELLSIMELLEANSIEALAFKGPTLAQIAYGNITLRQYLDLDILVGEDDAFRAGKLMSENGHVPVLPLTILSSKTCLHTAKEFSLVNADTSTHTELHWRLFKRKYNISLLSGIMEKKYQRVTINGKEIPTLPNEPLLVYLCLHGAKHTFERIEWICDIDRLIHSSDIDWEKTIAIADRSNSKRSFYLGLSLAHNLFSAKLPENIMQSIASKDIIVLEAMTLKQLSERNDAKNVFEKRKDTFFYQSRLFDRRSDMLHFYFSTFFKISAYDCEAFILPEKLKFLYIILRPVRLVSKYIKRFFITRSTSDPLK